MMTWSNVYKKIFICSLFAFSCSISAKIFSESVSDWVIAAEKFDIIKNDSTVNSVEAEIQEMIPNRILENLSSIMYRTITGEEEFERESYKLKTERMSLYLQLSSEVSARDALLLNDYTEKQLDKALSEAKKKIKIIQNKIDENLKKQKELEEKSILKISQDENNKELTEGQKYIRLFKGLVSNNSESQVLERVLIYETSSSNLYKPSEKAKKDGYKSYAFEKEIVNAKIKSLITGKISVVEDYFFVTVELFSYPGCKSLGVVSEIGSINDVSFLCSSIARQITPLISASLPVKIVLNVEPEEARSSLRFAIDDIVFRQLNDEYVIDEGVHTIRFDSEGFRTAITSFNFEGNCRYEISIEMQKENSTELNVNFKTPMFGSVYSNGDFIQSVDAENQVAKIKINDSIILGQFIGTEDENGFFYVPENLILDNVNLDVSVKTFDKSVYIDKRRRLMYTSYSVFVVSLLGSIFTAGNANSYKTAYQFNSDNSTILQNGNAWIVASNVCLGVTIAAGCWFGYELVRYFMAADSVLPAKAKKSKNVKKTENEAAADINTEIKIEDEEKWDLEAN